MKGFTGDGTGDNRVCLKSIRFSFSAASALNIFYFARINPFTCSEK